MKHLVLLTVLASTALPAPVLAGPSDRHEGVYRFAEAPAQHCIEQVRRAQAAPKRPTRLAELPAAYAVRLKNGQETRSSPCFRLERER